MQLINYTIVLVSPVTTLICCNALDLLTLAISIYHIFRYVLILTIFELLLIINIGDTIPHCGVFSSLIIEYLGGMYCKVLSRVL